jgi:hypothetical protein
MNDQLLRMQWLSDLVTSGVQAVGLDPASRIGGSMQFFVYDVIKIFILLSVLIFAISYVQSYFPPERTRRILGGRSGIGANILGALLGTITPFCSCSSIPLFIGFTAAGLPLGVTFSFLISSPLVDMASVILLASIFSWPIALAYVGVGLLVAIIGGTIIGKLGMEDQVAGFVRNVPVTDADESLTRAERVTFTRDQVGVHRVQQLVIGDARRGQAHRFGWRPDNPQCLLRGDIGGGEQGQKLRTGPALDQILDHRRYIPRRLDDPQHIARRAAVGVMMDHNRKGHCGKLPRVRLAKATSDSITGTSTSTPTTVTSAAPEFRPNRPMATATASSKKFDVPISAQGAAILCGRRQR